MKGYLKFYESLNEKQRRAVDHLDGPVLVLAGPGTGKTQLLSVRAAAILENRNCEPENILILTYTNSAAREMKERLAKVIGLRGYDVEVSTFHGFANSIIQDSEEAANYVGDKIQMSDIEKVRILEYVIDHASGIDDIRPFRAPYMYVNDIVSRIGELKREGITSKEFEAIVNKKKDWPGLEDKHIKKVRELSVVYRMYEELKEGKDNPLLDERGRYDFDDMILLATESLKKEKILHKDYSERIKYVMVDEFQDTNGAQLNLLFTLLNYKNPNLCCVGDDDQSIYRFQGASVENFMALKKHYPGIKDISLEDNYRSSESIISTGKRMIEMIPLEERTCDKALNAKRKFKDTSISFSEFVSDEEELAFLVDEIQRLHTKILKTQELSTNERSHPYNNIAVLLRKRSDIIKIIDALLQAGIPYATDGKEDISGEKRVRQMLDILDLANLATLTNNEKDLAFYKVVTSDYWRIQMKDILKFIGHANSKRQVDDKSRNATILSAFIDYFSSNNDTLNLESITQMKKCATLIKWLLENAEAIPVHTLLLTFIRDAGIFDFILKHYKDNDILRIRELRALTSFVNIIKTSDMSNPGIRLKDFMAEIETKNEHGIPIQGELVSATQDGVRLYTAHASKGMEFYAVIIPFCLQNKNWPKKPFPAKIPALPDILRDSGREEKSAAAQKLFKHDEIRLFYVALTRAKSNIIITATQSENTIPSQFIDVIGIEKAGAIKSKEEELLKKFLSKSDKEDPLIGTTSIVRDLITNMTLNPTRINNYLSCPRKFFYNDVLKLPGPKRKGLVFGNCVHKALEETYKSFQESGKFPDFKFFRAVFDKELKFQGVDEAIKLHCTNIGQMKKIEGWFNLAKNNPIMPLDLEKKLTITVGDNIIFTGKFDKIEWEDEKEQTVRIIDYKTGRPDDHIKADETLNLSSDQCDGYIRQLVCYRLLYEKDKNASRGRKAFRGSLVFIEPVSADIKKCGLKKGDYTSKTITITDKMVSDMESIVIDVWKNINRQNFSKLKERDQDKCRNCDFDSFCWS